MEVNGRSIAIISEAVGGTNVDNCPHSCTNKPCGPLAECIPNLDSYECQCNPSNIQCNKAEELTVVQATIHSGLTSTFNFTGVSGGNRSSISANDTKNPLDLTTATASASVQTNLPEVHEIAATAAAESEAATSTKTTTFTTTTTMANEQRKYNAEIIATLSLSNSKSPVIQLSDPYAKYNKTVAKDHSDSIKYNDKENDNASSSSESDATNVDDYYDDGRPSALYLDGTHSIQKKISDYNDYDYKNDNLPDIHTMPVVSSTTISTVSGDSNGDNYDDGNGNGSDHGDTITIMKNINTEQIDAKPLLNRGDGDGGGGGISTDDDVTKVFGRYMSIDTEKLLKKEKMLLLKSKQLHGGAHKKTVKQQQQMAKKKHYIPMPLLEPQSPSLADDEIEIDIMLPTTKNDQRTTVTETATVTTEASPATTTAAATTKIVTTPTTTSSSSSSSSSTAKTFQSENKQMVGDNKNNNGNDNHNDADDGGDGDGDGGNDDDEMSSEFDVMGFYSNEDVLTTKELIDDMARIMKNGAEIRRNQMNRKTKYVRRSHGACFTGADR